MITLLIIAGFLGILAPVFGFMALFVGGLFMVSTVAGWLSFALVVLLVIGIWHIK